MEMPMKKMINKEKMEHFFWMVWIIIVIQSLSSPPHLSPSSLSFSQETYPSSSVCSVLLIGSINSHYCPPDLPSPSSWASSLHQRCSTPSAAHRFRPRSSSESESHPRRTSLTARKGLDTQVMKLKMVYFPEFYSLTCPASQNFPHTLF